MAHDLRHNARELSISLAKKTPGSSQEPGVFLQFGSITKPKDAKHDDYIRMEYQLAEVRFHTGFQYTGDQRPTTPAKPWYGRCQSESSDPHPLKRVSPKRCGDQSESDAVAARFRTRSRRRRVPAACKGKEQHDEVLPDSM
jgi:hypothetical protein